MSFYTWTSPFIISEIYSEAIIDICHETIFFRWICSKLKGQEVSNMETGFLGKRNFRVQIFSTKIELHPSKSCQVWIVCAPGRLLVFIGEILFYRSWWFWYDHAFSAMSIWLEYVYIKRNAPVWSPTNRRLSWLENKNNKSSLVGDQTTERPDDGGISITSGWLLLRTNAFYVSFIRKNVDRNGMLHIPVILQQYGKSIPHRSPCQNLFSGW